MIDQLRSEVLKLRTVRSSVVMLVVVVLVSLAPAILLASLVPKRTLLEVSRNDRVSIALAGVNFAQLLIAVIAALLLAAEFRFGTIRTTFVAQPRRLVVLAAKTVVVIGLAAFVATLMVAVTSGIGGTIIRSRSVEYSWTAGDAWRVHWGTILYSILYAVLALAIAAIVRNAAATVVIVIVIPLVVEPIVRVILTAADRESWVRWLPFAAGQEIANPRSGASVAARLSPWAGYGYAWLWAAALLGLGAWLLVRRDA